MMKVITIVVLALHGLIHLFGYAKAFNLTDGLQLSHPISKWNGVLWLLGTILFMASAALLAFDAELWWQLAAIAVVLSQYLIFTSWQDAKFGTIANALIFTLAVVGFSTWQFHRSYLTQVRELAVTPGATGLSLTQGDIDRLPGPVRKYLQYAGAVGKPRVTDFEVRFSGTIRSAPDSPWMPFTSEQYNCVDESTRLFFLNARMKGLPVSGFHSFRNGTAYMDIRLLSLFSVQYQSGPEMGIAETVTFFNDMCVMAPATLIDERIEWLAVDGNSIKAEFRNNGIAVTAWLYFNEMGELINFVSDDRYAIVNGEMKKLRWSTPLKDYKDFGGVKLASHGETVYAYPDGDFTYGVFTLSDVIYNPTLDQLSPGREELPTDGDH